MMIYAKGTAGLGTAGLNGSLFHRVLNEKFPGMVAFEGAFYLAVTSFLTLFTG